MERILVFGMTENPGGVESFLLNYYRYIDKEKIQFDFLCNSYNPVAYEEELLRLGARTFHIIARSKNFRRYKKELEHVFREHASEWSAIWVNVSSLANIDYLKIAKKYSIKKRIIHSHASGNMDSTIRGLLHKWNKSSLESWATDFWACSEDAAKWFYKKQITSKMQIIHNAIDVKSLMFDGSKRKDIRQRLGIDNNTYVIGNIGRLQFPKNQSLAIEVFREYQKKDPESILIMIGQGPDEPMLRKKASDLKGKVLFAGVQTDIQGWLSTLDLFIFPSIFEGLGIAALEAQANGLPVLASKECIPNEVKIMENFVFYGLDRSPANWAETIHNMRKELSRSRVQDITNAFMERGYDISTETRKLEGLFVK